tara:strand:+ start:755 stop:961 length:207 start_codon:yes stop_codon:yes gene_type:complete
MPKLVYISLIIMILLFNNSAIAYLGPGVGVGILAATVGIIIAIFAAIFGIIYFPIKRLLKKRKEKKDK